MLFFILLGVDFTINAEEKFMSQEEYFANSCRKLERELQEECDDFLNTCLEGEEVYKNECYKLTTDVCLVNVEYKVKKCFEEEKIDN